MKKRLLSYLLAASLALTALVLPAAAAETAHFSDVTDRETAIAVESLRLLGVLDGYADGSFRPEAILNRAQFCKMAVYAMDGENALGQYRTVTVFPDVKPSHWAAPYINMAAKGKAIIAGNTDGKFHPEKTITVGQAVTILLRLLGYKDEEVGGIWPQGHMAVAATTGLTDGVSSDGFAPLTRGQAARLFLNLLRADMKEGGAYISNIGTPVANTMLVSSTATGPDGRKTAIQTANGDVYQLASGKISNGTLNGYKGTLVLAKKGGKALTFVPDVMGHSRTVTLATKSATQIVDSSGVKYTLESTTKTFYNGKEEDWGNVNSWLHSGTSVTLYLNEAGGVEYVFVGGGSTATAAVVVYEDRSSAGFDSLTGGSTNYSLYKNGEPATLGDLRKYDVAVYSASTNSIRVCDTRVTVFYESCTPNPNEPSKLTALGHEFDVLPTAMDSVSKFRPGDQMTLLLTDGGQVAGAVEATGNAARGNAVGIMSSSGAVQLLCGTAKISITAGEAANYKGQLVQISSSKKDSVNLSRLSGGVSGDLNVPERKLGGKNLSEHVMVFRDGQDVSLNQLTNGIITRDQISYARTNWAGEVDLIVLGDVKNGTIYYGRAVVTTTKDESGNVSTEVEVVYGDGKSTGKVKTGYAVRTGDFVAVTLNSQKDGYSSLQQLTELSDVPNSAWSGQSSVTVGGRSYTVPSDVPCYNSTGKSWISLSTAHAYADRATLYVADGIVRAIEVA